MRSALDDPRFPELILRLQLTVVDGALTIVPTGNGAWLDRPALTLAVGLLNKRYKQLRKIHRAASNLSNEEMHDVRISTKKMRYVAEFFHSLYPKRATKEFINSLIEVQDCLGSINDAVVGQRLSQLLEASIAGSVDQGTARHADGLVLGWYTAGADQAMGEFKSAWRRLRGCSPFWRK